MVLKLLTYNNRHGYGVSMVSYEGDNVTGGFVLQTFEDEAERDKYAKDLAQEFKFELESLFAR